MRVFALVLFALLFIGFGSYFTFSKRLEAERKRREAYATRPIQPLRTGTEKTPTARDGEVTKRDLEFIEEPISSIEELDDGVLAIGLGPMARSFVIHPELSPDAKALVAFARTARQPGKKVHATAWIRDRSPKKPGGVPGVPWPYVLVRLAESPDPRAAASERDR